MTGVEILATHSVAIDFAFNWLAFWITFGVLFVVFVGLGILIGWINIDWDQTIIGAIAGVVIGIIMATFFGNILAIPSAYENQYKITITDEVSMNEFLERYEIVEQEGEIYTVRERE